MTKTKTVARRDPDQQHREPSLRDRLVSNVQATVRHLRREHWGMTSQRRRELLDAVQVARQLIAQAEKTLAARPAVQKWQRQVSP